MKAQPDCIVCLFRQALSAVRLVTDDPEIHRQVLAKIARLVADTSLDNTPAGFSQPAYKIIEEITGVKDPYKNLKKETNRIALNMKRHLRLLIEKSDDPLDAALHVAAAGNVIDAGVDRKFDVEKDVIELIGRNFAINDIEDLKKELGRGKKLFYIGDNAGEIVFDTLLVEQILKTRTEIIFTVKSGPIINDATMEDAEVSGMTKLVKVIETGSNAIGINWQDISDEFRQAVENTDIIIGKGHGNFETCNDRPENIYFLLKVKCPMVANAIGAEVENIVFKHLHR